MNDGVKVWIFLLLLPFLAAIGHDLYASYYAAEEERTKLVEYYDIDPGAFKISDAGYLLVTYAPDAYNTLRESVGPERWMKWVDPILRLYSFVVALIPLAVFLTWLLISRILDIWPFMGNVARAHRRTPAAPKSSDRLNQISKRNNEKGKFKYKRG